MHSSAPPLDALPARQANFAMEYVAGETLAARIATGPVTVDDALSLIRSAALGLRDAQRSGITHRDIKPSNLMIDGHGMVKVLDFGLAAAAPNMTDASDATGELAAGPVAQTSLAGTPLYMAPEQARGEPVDFRTDVYALGATLFHLVGHSRPAGLWVRSMATCVDLVIASLIIVAVAVPIHCARSASRPSGTSSAARWCAIARAGPRRSSELLV